GHDAEPEVTLIADEQGPWISYTTLEASTPFNAVFHFFGLENDPRLGKHLGGYVSAAHGLIILDDVMLTEAGRKVVACGHVLPTAILAKAVDGQNWKSITGQAPVYVGALSSEHIGPAINEVAKAALAETRTLAAISSKSNLDVG
ncbi:MAG: hypothetical protein ABIP48_17430, partial [Planctomycetota bacterium]